VQQYDELIVMPLLKVVMGFLNPNQACKLNSSITQVASNFNWVV
jgi:hypothetical protein